ncbi:hypothetical protein VN23_05905 [Janthinobacterium sp. B9-8]|nr:hypothetical protein VN23_05905 [Janthinobacterium sp. B9-8]
MTLISNGIPPCFSSKKLRNHIKGDAWVFCWWLKKWHFSLDKIACVNLNAIGIFVGRVAALISPADG